jgi:uncharacterized iron-regulated membrane protein
MSITIDAVRDAWDYTLTLESPKPSKTCPTQHVAHCGGRMSQLIWYITGGLSGLTIALGILYCYVRHFRRQKKTVKPKKRKVEVATINAWMNSSLFSLYSNHIFQMNELTCSLSQ